MQAYVGGVLMVMFRCSIQFLGLNRNTALLYLDRRMKSGK
jgi:hypothetical protein